MINEIDGNSYKYTIDTSYGINKDGFIAIGSESVVYKGLKVKREGGLQFSCVLKFKPRSIMQNGEVIDRLALFKNEEWRIFEELRECRSVVRIEDVIDDLGDFSLPCSYVASGEINSSQYFCVIEEYVDGWSLEEFCREEYWKLRRTEALSNGLSIVVNYLDFPAREKAAIEASYNYDNTLKYQNQILLFMINLCEIMEFISEQMHILHLDIKPENIMVTRHGKELVLIDFGKSKMLTPIDKFAFSALPDVDYNQVETVERQYQHGTLGYAAPECFSVATYNSGFPFTPGFRQGAMSIESDIFSFGATFWECLNLFELVTRNEQFSRESYEFYRQSFLTDDLYNNRDLSCTSVFYHKKLENVLKKCTRKRSGAYTDSGNKNYYHSYRELRRDIENAMESAPTIIKEENTRVKNALNLCGSMLAVFTAFLALFMVYRLMAFTVAERKWDDLTANYNDTQLYRLEAIADDLISTAPRNKIDETYESIARFTYQDGDISEYEAVMLVRLLAKIGDNSQLPGRIDEIMCNANTRKFKEISIEVVKLDPSGESVGYDLARAIFNAEVGKTEIADAFETLVLYADETEFLHAVVKLKNVLDNDAYIKVISNSLGLSRPEIQEVFRYISAKEKP